MSLGLHKTELDTPCLVIDKALLLDNINCMQQEVNQAGKNSRPHIKTHKCSEIAKLQVLGGALGVGAAKVSEAKVLADSGLKNTLITSPVVTEQKIATLQECLKKDAGLIVVVDSIENAKALNRAAKEVNTTLKVLIDIDAGIGRTGIQNSEVISFAKVLKPFGRLNLQGLQCYAGNLQHVESYQKRREASLSVMEKAAFTFNELKNAGFKVDILSGSGTGTYDIDLTIPEVSEVQPGSYTVMDSEYLTIGSKEDAHRYAKFKPAMRLLTSIISSNQKAHVTCDAGWKALYQVPTKPIVIQPEGYQYDWGGFGDEHGKITARAGAPLPQSGEVLELMVAHCDPTINLFDSFYVTENDIVTDVWPIDMRGKSQ